MNHFFQTHFILFIFMIAIIGFCVGSFLNVVIYRLPFMLLKKWGADEFSELPQPPKTNLSLISPGSFCPNCKEKIPFYLNIPVLGYFLSRQKCRFCAQKISFTYPLIEFMSGLAGIAIAYRWGVSLETLAALIFTWILIPLIFIDIKHHLLPDVLTLMGVWLGLSFNLFNLFTPIEDAVVGAVSGYLSLWIIAQLFKVITKREGMGYGDFKLFSMMGAWQGWENLPFILLQASLLGLFISLVGVIAKKKAFNAPIAFGPYLASSGWVTLFFGQYITSFYQIFLGKLLGWE